jgi:hypothetical protein
LFHLEALRVYSPQHSTATQAMRLAQCQQGRRATLDHHRGRRSLQPRRQIHRDLVCLSYARSLWVVT